MQGFNFAHFRTMLGVVRRGEESDDGLMDSFGLDMSGIDGGLRTMFMVVIGALAMVGLFLAGMKFIAPMGLAVQTVFSGMLCCAAVITVFFGFYNAVSSLYFVRDLSFYLTLPVSPTAVMWAKLFNFMSTQMAIEMVPLGLGLGALFGSGAAVGDMVALVLAYVICAVTFTNMLIIVTVPLMRFSHFAADKDRFARVFGVVTLLISLAIGLLLSRGSEAIQAAQGAGSAFAAVAAGGPVVALLGVLCAPSLLTGLTFSGGAVLGILGMAVLMLVYMVVLHLVAKRWYFEGARNMQGGAGAHSAKRLSDAELKGAVRRRGQFGAFLSQDIKSSVRTPSFFQNFVVQPLIMPIVSVGTIIALVVFQSSEGPAEAYASIASQTSSMEFGDLTFVILLMIAIAVALSVTVMSFYSSYAPSRDGFDFFYLSTMPMDLKSYVQAKLCSGLLVTRVPVFALLFVLLLAFQVNVLFAALLIAVFALVTCAADILWVGIGCLRPNLRWENEAELMKGGSTFIRFVLCLVSSVLGCGLPVLGVVLSVFFVPDLLFAACVAAPVIAVAECAAVYAWTFGFAYKKLGLVRL